ncbi:MAG: hypothetical protein U9P72_02245 [Campylobacterota bacterium]|nr:hypothetical protein [Campylobacterota bacterium]
MKFLIYKIGNWVSTDKDEAVSTTTLPFGLIAIVKNGTTLSFTKGVSNV